jgi:hypothetical protein
METECLREAQHEHHVLTVPVTTSPTRVVSNTTTQRSQNAADRHAKTQNY